jgi:hypothetical protein
MGAESAEEVGVGGEAAPALGDKGGVQEVGRPRQETEHDLVEEVIVFQRMHQRRGGSAAGAATAFHCGRRSSTGLRAARRERGLKTGVSLFSLWARSVHGN